MKTAYTLFITTRRSYGINLKGDGALSYKLLIISGQHFNNKLKKKTIMSLALKCHCSSKTLADAKTLVMYAGYKLTQR